MADAARQLNKSPLGENTEMGGRSQTGSRTPARRKGEEAESEEDIIPAGSRLHQDYVLLAAFRIFERLFGGTLVDNSFCGELRQ